MVCVLSHVPTTCCSLAGACLLEPVYVYVGMLGAVVHLVYMNKRLHPTGTINGSLFNFMPGPSHSGLEIG
jgi:hypothetical protein